MDTRPDNCPYAFRRPGDPNVLCHKIAEQPHVQWCYCAQQYDCRLTGRWEIKPDAKRQCKFRKEG